jgi:hypothetical protein
MKIGTILGILLVGFGVWVVSGHALFRTRRSVLEIGDMKASVTETHTLPPWVGYASCAGGVVLLVVAAGRRRA